MKTNGGIAAACVAMALAGCASTPQAVAIDPVPELPATSCPDLKRPPSWRPPFPRTMADIGQEGWVIVEFDIDAAGVARNSRIWASSPKGAFDEAVLKSLKYAIFDEKGPLVSCRPLIMFTLSK